MTALRTLESLISEVELLFLGALCLEGTCEDVNQRDTGKNGLFF